MERSTDRRRAVDRGFAWVVLAASFVVQASTIGCSFGSIGVMTVSFGKEFQTVDNGQLGWIGGLRSFQFLASPISVLLIKRFGYRLVTIGGALVSGLGIAISIYCTALWQVYITYSIIAGIGISCSYTCSSAILQEYFDKKKNIAFPLATLGDTIGMVIVPYLVQFIINTLGHKHALLITAALKVLEIVAGIFFKPNDGSELFHKCCRRKQQNVTPQRIEESVQNATDRNPSRDVSADERPSLVTELNSRQSNAAARYRMLSLLREWQVWALILHACCWGITASSTVALSPIYVERKGIGSDDASLGITIMGAGHMVSSFATFAAGSRAYNRFLLYMFTTGLTGLCAVLMTLSTLVAVYFTMCFMFGIWLCTLLSLFMTIIAEYNKPDDFADLFGLYRLLNGIGCLAGPVIVGYIQQAYGDDVGFYACGGFGIIASLVLIPVYIARRKSLRIE